MGITVLLYATVTPPVLSLEQLPTLVDLLVTIWGRLAIVMLLVMLQIQVPTQEDLLALMKIPALLAQATLLG